MSVSPICGWEWHPHLAVKPGRLERLYVHARIGRRLAIARVGRAIARFESEGGGVGSKRA